MGSGLEARLKRHGAVVAALPWSADNAKVRAEDGNLFIDLPDVTFHYITVEADTFEIAGRHGPVLRYEFHDPYSTIAGDFTIQGLQAHVRGDGTTKLSVRPPAKII